MSFTVRFTPGAEADLLRRYDYLLTQDLATAEAAQIAIGKALHLLEDFPFACRKVIGFEQRAELRELLISFGRGGYVALFEIDAQDTLTVLAVRHQREADYH